MGNVSAASIPIAIADAVRDGAIPHPMRVFAPGFGAGAVGGYAVLRVDPAIVAPEATGPVEPAAPHREPAATTSDDVRVAFGE
jgi:3-oxoacyl-[acyl-carrier-protein] synthase-3